MNETNIPIPRDVGKSHNPDVAAVWFALSNGPRSPAQIADVTATSRIMVITGALDELQQLGIAEPVPDEVGPLVYRRWRLVGAE